MFNNCVYGCTFFLSLSFQGDVKLHNYGLYFTTNNGNGVGFPIGLVWECNRVSCQDMCNVLVHCICHISMRSGGGRVLEFPLLPLMDSHHVCIITSRPSFWPVASLLSTVQCLDMVQLYRSRSCFFCFCFFCSEQVWREM